MAMLFIKVVVVDPGFVSNHWEIHSACCVQGMVRILGNVTYIWVKGVKEKRREKCLRS